MSGNFLSIVDIETFTKLKYKFGHHPFWFSSIKDRKFYESYQNSNLYNRFFIEPFIFRSLVNLKINGWRKRLIKQSYHFKFA